MSIKPKLNFLDITMAVVSLVIGIGIFRTPSIVAQNTGNTLLFFTAWILGGFIAMMGGLVFAEIGSRKPLAGGFYKIVSEVYHPSIGFMLNWVYFFINCASFAAVCLIGSEYLCYILPINEEYLTIYIKLISICVTLLLFIINFIGIKMGSIALDIITFLKISMILLFSILAFVFSIENGANQNIDISHISSGNPILALGTGLIAVFFTYGGYQMTMNLCSDVLKPKRNIPLGIFTGIIIITTLYLLIITGYYTLLGFEGIAQSDLIAVDMAKAIFGDTGKKLISIVIFISILGFLNATLLQMPRALYAMSEDNILPSIFMKINSKTQVQEFTLIFITALVIIFILIYGSFEKIISMLIYNETIIIGIFASTIFVLRKKINVNSDNKDNFNLPFYPYLPIIFLSFLLLVIISAFVDNIISSLISTLFLLIGYPVYLILKKLNNK